jgi:hypothetical protein
MKRYLCIIISATALTALYIGSWIYGLDWPAWQDSKHHAADLFNGFPPSLFPLVDEQLKSITPTDDYYYRYGIRDQAELYRTQLARVHVDWLVATYRMTRISATDPNWFCQGFYTETPYWWKPKDIKPADMELYDNGVLTFAYDTKTKVAYIRQIHP